MRTGGRLDNVLHQIAQERADAILLVGDIGSHDLSYARRRTPERDARYLASVEEVLRRCQDLGVPVRYVPGNHDLPELCFAGNADGRPRCGVKDSDTDADGTADCCDGCNSESLKIAQGIWKQWPAGSLAVPAAGERSIRTQSDALGGSGGKAPQPSVLPEGTPAFRTGPEFPTRTRRQHMPQHLRSQETLPTPRKPLPGSGGGPVSPQRIVES